MRSISSLMNLAHLVSASPGDLADRLGELKAAIADLKNSEEHLKELLKACGPGAYEGARYRATVSEQDRLVVDWRAVAERLNPSRQLLAAHSEEQHLVRVEVRARKSDS